MPLNWFSKPSKRKDAGAIGRLVDRIAPNWRRSPIRPFVQGLCLVAFLYLFLYVCFPTGAVPPPQDASAATDETAVDALPSHYSAELSKKEVIPVESFLAIDPLVGLSTAIASRTWVWSLAFAGVILLVCLVVPRGFCGYVCPLGTVIDLFDWALGKRARQFHLAGRGWYVHLKYYVLTGVLVAALFGVLVSGFVAAVPVVTRAAVFLLSPLEVGLVQSWQNVPPMNSGQVFSIGLFVAVLCLGFLKPRFWCRHVCPSGALFSIAAAARLTERKVDCTCIECGKCTEVCPFDAIHPDFTTRTADCTFCQTCGGACPVGAIRFVPRWQSIDAKKPSDEPSGETPIGRRGFLAAGIGATAATLSGAATAGAISAINPKPGGEASAHLVRPPGSIPEDTFIRQCIRCGECLQVCPNDALQPQGFAQGLSGLWTPTLNANWAGCEPSCNNCGRVCPTGAIRSLPMKEKQVVRMGLAEVNKQTCLPYAGIEECRQCVDECAAVGRRAIEFIKVGTQVDEQGMPVEGTGMLAPVVVAEKCVGCGMCQMRCYSVNVKAKRLLRESAVVVHAGPGKEDRTASGSYIALRAEEERRREAEREKQTESNGGGGGYLPDFLK